VWSAHTNPAGKLGAVISFSLLFLFTSFAGRTELARAQEDASPIPLLAYYYIWFDQSSWDRAKTDYPLLGRYTSDDIVVMEQHIQWAKDAGIQGFIVSWKGTDSLNQRLGQLVELASQENFKLAVIYQGLDFERDPLPISTIASDFEYFENLYGDEPVFELFGKPVVIWSGTWKFSEQEVAEVTSAYRDRLNILASERNLDGYLRLAQSVDGNAYYWSSVDPDTYPGYQEKLDTLSAAIHARGGLWFAPAAPGFDARLIGGTRVVDRKDGDTLLHQLQVAINSSPDAVGLISWNEFSENTHLEPSESYGTRYLEVLAEYSHLTVPIPLQFDSSEIIETPGVENQEGAAGKPLAAIGLVLGLLFLSLLMIGFRRNTV